MVTNTDLDERQLNDEVLDDISPIFIVGCPSSGTTLMQSVLNAHPNIMCGPETDFLPSLEQIVDGKFQKKLKHYDFGREYWLSLVASLFTQFKADHASHHGKHRWADKSPIYTSCLPFIYSLFPNCQIIHVIRDGRDVVMSHRNRWGYKSAIKSTFLWRKYIETARDFGKTIPSNQYYEVRYEDLVNSPDNAVQELLNFLREPWDPEILKYNKAPGYSENGKYALYTEARRRETKDQSLIYKSRIGVGRNLDPLLKALIYFQDNSLLKELGY